MSSAASAAGAGISPAGWDRVTAYMLRHCGVVLGEDQHYLLEPRLAPVARAHHCPNVNDFVAQAVESAPLSEYGMALIDAMTTHETMFFRDPPFWKALEKTVLPQLIEAAGARPLRIWVAACSLGQEAYSLAMLLEEQFPAQAERAEIIANDVAAATVERAKHGQYSTLEVNRGLGATRLQKHFEQAHGGFILHEWLRKRIRWGVHNLLGAAAEPKNCDLVLCRNVLIYFGDADRAEVIRRLFRSAGPGGVVGIGTTESIMGMQTVAPGLYPGAAHK